MISDKERREVARELRELDVSDIGDADNVVDAPEDVGLLFALMLEVANDYRPGLHYAMSHFKAKDAVELFADLIDRPTCKNESGYKNIFLCSECGARLEVAAEEGNEYGDIFNTQLQPRFCSVCGKRFAKTKKTQKRCPECIAAKPRHSAERHRAIYRREQA